MTNLNLPPHRSIPPDVEDRIRATVDAGASVSLSSGRQSPLAVTAVAAGVALLAVGAVVVTQSEPTTDQTTAPLMTVAAASSPDLSENELSAAVDRCAAAAPALGPRDQWVPELGINRDGISVVGARVGDKPVICQTTSWNVTVTDPATADGAAVLLKSPEGVVAGFVDPTWPYVGFHLRTSGMGMVGVAEVEGGFFATIAFPELAGAELRVFESAGMDPTTRWEQATPVDDPAPSLMVVDQPGAPADGDDEALDRCLRDAGVDDKSWVPGAGAAQMFQFFRMLLVRSDDRLGLCRFDLTTSKYVLDELTPVADATRLCVSAPVDVDTSDMGRPSGDTWLAGTVRQDAAYVDAKYEGGLLQRVPVVQGTFLLPETRNDAPLETIAIHDRNRTLLTEGPPGKC